MQDPWLVMHKIDSPTKMRYVGNRVAACNASDPTAVPKSIAEFVKRPGAHVCVILLFTLPSGFVSALILSAYCRTSFAAHISHEGMFANHAAFERQKPAYWMSELREHFVALCVRGEAW